MERNEEGTLARLKTLRREVVEPAIDSHRGRLVKLTGDGVLVEFSSAVDAVRSAVAIQQSIAAREQNEPSDRRVSLRIGVNLGDIIVEGDDVYGDGVNISARLEGLADPGGIVISGNVYDEVARRLPVGFEDMGELRVKNIDRSIRAWRVLPEGAVASPRQASVEPVAGKEPPALPLPDKPSIAVLPFTNMSGDPEQDYFADGLSEDIITELSRFRWLFVIARNSCFVYKGRAVDIRTVGRELGVRYVLEGGVRKSGERLRITAQLIEAATGNHLWAEKYDGKLADVFDVQDNITRTIVATLPGRIEAAYAERIVRTPPKDMAAYELLLGAKVLHHRATKDDNAAAFALVERAIGIDPGFAQAYAWKACLTGQAVARGFFDDGNPREHLKRAFDLVMKGLALDENDIECHRVLCESFMDQGDLARARTHHDRAFALNPNDARIVAQRGELMTWLGEPEQAVEWLQTAMHLDPFGVRERAHLLGRALLAARRYEEAADAYRQSAVRHRPEFHADLAAALAQAGRADEAAAEVAETLRIKPEFSVSSYVKALHYGRDADREHHREALIKAGLPA